MENFPPLIIRLAVQEQLESIKYVPGGIRTGLPMAAAAVSAATALTVPSEISTVGDIARMST
jgi:hypothetical protein